MLGTELKQIKDHWTKKYPDVFITICANESSRKFFGRMMGSQENIDLSADTIGDLISQGEAFLRRVSI